MTHLFLFQIGPVQTFIAQARRTQDLFIGSHLLSELATAGVISASALPGFKSIFPVLENGRVKGGAPHRFAFLCDANPTQVAERVETAVKRRWRDGFALPVRKFVEDAAGGEDWVKTFERQIDNWLEFYWVAVPYSDHVESFRRASAAMAQRKYARMFTQVEEPSYKCTLTGAQSALNINWNRLRKRLGDEDEKVFRLNENLGSLALVKRLAALAGCIQDQDYEGFPSTNQIAADDPNWRESDSPKDAKEVTGYLAVLHMDGDQMGARLSDLNSLRAHQEFSHNLAVFAAEGALVTIEKFGGKTGRLVYSGGDDVLALLPLRHVLKCADELRKLFFSMTNCRSSAGIAITPANLPLDMALELARQAEEDAKEVYGRDALVFVEAHGSGQLREAGAKWEIVEFLQTIQALFERQALSGKFGYDLLAIDHDLSGAELREAREMEIYRLAKRRIQEGASKETKQDIAQMVQKMIDLVEIKRKWNPDSPDEIPTSAVPTWSAMANWIILARFLAQGVRAGQEAVKA
jgi:CRISPR-associated protein Cmr2